MNLSGVYEIKNIKTDKRYIGSSQDIKYRFYQHLSMLRNGNHHSVHLQRSWNKYGELNFILQPLIYCDRDATLYFEQALIDHFNPEYNIAKCAEASARGAKRSISTRKKISEVQKGKIRSKEEIQKRIESRAGYEHSLHTRTKISNAIKDWYETVNGKNARQKFIDRKQRKVICLDNGKVYDSIKCAAEELNVERSKISAVARGKRNQTGGYRFAYAGGTS